MAPPRRPRPSNPTSRTTNTSTPTPLPDYQPATHPLNANAQRALHELPRAHRLDGLQTHLSQAINSLTAAAGDINDRSQQKSAHHQKRKARRQARAGEDEDENENENDSDHRAVEEMRGKVVEMTADLELRVRKIVDARAAVENVAMVLKELDANLTNGQGAIVPTQSTLGASQLRQKRRRANADLSDDEDGNEDVDPTGPLVVFQQKVDNFYSEYDDSSLRHRYASNNDYIGFKKIVHDARHPQHDAPPLPHASTWFPRSASSSPSHNPSSKQNKQSKSAAPNNDDDDDDEIEVASERISISCPITLRPMEVPVSSSVCPHSFERAAVLEMISKSPIRPRVTPGQAGSGLERQMKCPVSGCNAMLSPSLLHPDLILTRKIKRLLHAAQASPSPSPSPPHSQPTATASFPSSSKRKTRDEPRNRFKREVSMVPATQLEEITREEEEEEEEEGEDEGEGEGVGSGTQILDLEDEDEDEDGDEDEDEDE